MIGSVHPSLLDVGPAGRFTAKEFLVAGIVWSEICLRIAIATIVVGCTAGIVQPLCGIHHLGYIMECRECNGSCIVQGHLAFLTSLGGYENHTVGTTCTIDSGSRSILQYLDALDVLRVDIIDTTVLDDHTIHYIERITFGTDRALTTDGDATYCTRALRIGDIHTGSLTLHTLQGILYRHSCQVLGIQVGQGTGYIALALHTITYYYDFIQSLVVFQQSYLQIALSGNTHFLGCITDIRNFYGSILWHIGQSKVTIKISYGTIGSAYYFNTGANNRLTHVIYHCTFYGFSLLYYIRCCIHLSYSDRRKHQG